MLARKRGLRVAVLPPPSGGAFDRQPVTSAMGMQVTGREQVFSAPTKNMDWGREGGHGFRPSH